MTMDGIRRSILDWPLAHTYSIVARDPETSEMGVAVQSHYFAVGSVVTWAEAGVGAVATQALTDPAYGKLGLDLMRAGKNAPETLAGLVASDAANAVRQVAMIDAQGRVAAHTGSATIAEAGHFIGEGFSVQANMMLRPTVWPAMVEGYQSAKGELVDRILATLDAAEAEGGDIRGRQSAAILVVSGRSTGRPWFDTIYDIRVDDSPEPLAELRRLVSVARAYIHMRRGQSALERGEFEILDREFEAASGLTRDNPEIRFWHSIALLTAGKIEQGIAILREVASRDRNWITFALRLEAFMLPANPAIIEQIRALD
jgi:uncharacterized Ntn-hydrolase superfamily protein